LRGEILVIGKRLRELRKNKQISQEELARFLDLSTSSVGLYEADNRNPSYEVLLKIANYFCVTTDWMLGVTDEKTKSTNIPVDYADVISYAMSKDISAKKIKAIIDFVKAYESEFFIDEKVFTGK
jgi:transcriptional regulator with XRE-family HTH domain